MLRRGFHGAFLNVMKKYYPSYYNKFSCLAGACPDSCCRKWEIVIDNGTFEKYKLLKSSFGERILSEIITNDDGDYCFRLSERNCPFLNFEGLCDIHIQLGEDFTSEICRNHPRFIEEFDGFTEISLSLSCPEANRIIVSTENEKYPRPVYDGDDEVLELLIQSRDKLLTAETDFNGLIKLLLDTAADDSLDIDLTYIENHPEINVDFLKNFGKYLLNNAEILTDEWKELLMKTSSATVEDSVFSSFCNTNRSVLVKICRYYIYRYYLKAVNDLDIYSRALFVAAFCYFSSLTALICELPLSEAARLFSKETEHNLFNIDIIIRYFSDF